MNKEYLIVPDFVVEEVMISVNSNKLEYRVLGIENEFDLEINPRNKEEQNLIKKIRFFIQSKSLKIQHPSKKH